MSSEQLVFYSLEKNSFGKYLVIKELVKKKQPKSLKPWGKKVIITNHIQFANFLTCQFILNCLPLRPFFFSYSDCHIQPAATVGHKNTYKVGIK